MIEIGNRLKGLRASAMITQVQLAHMLNITQSSINRYENGQAMPPPKVLLWYADYFDVSMDYIFSRTENPKGGLYTNEPKIRTNSPELHDFIEMCFDPKSPLNSKLKESLLKIMEEEQR